MEYPSAIANEQSAITQEVLVGNIKTYLIRIEDSALIKAYEAKHGKKVNERFMTPYYEYRIYKGFSVNDAIDAACIEYKGRQHLEFVWADQLHMNEAFQATMHLMQRDDYDIKAFLLSIGFELNKYECAYFWRCDLAISSSKPEHSGLHPAQS